MTSCSCGGGGCGDNDIPPVHDERRRPMLCRSVCCVMFVMGFVSVFLVSELIVEGDSISTDSSSFIYVSTSKSCNRPASIDTKQVSDTIDGVSYEIIPRADIQNLLYT
jgi:hypothetical protein